jgi:hypothetical protein
MINRDPARISITVIPAGPESFFKERFPTRFACGDDNHKFFKIEKKF